MSAILVLIGIVFDVLVFIFVGDLELYGDEGDSEYRMIPMQTFAPLTSEPAQAQRYVPGGK